MKEAAPQQDSIYLHLRQAFSLKLLENQFETWNNYSGMKTARPWLNIAIQKAVAVISRPE